MPRTLLHTRTISIETHPFGVERLYVHGELRDVRYHDLPAYLGVEHPSGVVHHMGLDLEVDGDLVVREIEPFMATFPFAPSEKTRGESCPAVLPNYRKLLGLRLDPAYALRVLETVGGPRGCFHVLSLAQCIPAAVRAASRRLCGGALRMPARARESVRDSCSQWRAESPLWAKVRESSDFGFADFRRQIRVTAYTELRKPVGPGQPKAEGPADTDDGFRLGMTASLSDATAGGEPYGAELALRLEIPKFRIVSAEARLAGAPFPGCAEALEGVRGLEKLSITKGFTASALEKIGGGAGCAHLSALLVAVTPVSAQASGALAGFLKLSPEIKLRGRDTNPQVDSCHMWRAGGPLVSMGPSAPER